MPRPKIDQKRHFRHFGQKKSKKSSKTWMGQFRARKTVPLPLRFPKESLKGTIRLGGGGEGLYGGLGAGRTHPPTHHPCSYGDSSTGGRGGSQPHKLENCGSRHLWGEKTKRASIFWGQFEPTPLVNSRGAKRSEVGSGAIIGVRHLRTARNRPTQNLQTRSNKNWSSVRVARRVHIMDGEGRRFRSGGLNFTSGSRVGWVKRGRRRGWVCW